VAVAVRIKPGKMSRDDYDRLRSELAAQGADTPAGRLSHTAYGNDEVEMFEVWESKEHFDAPHDNVVAILQGAGLDAGSVDFAAVHSHPD
jgi:quinol monooxygenase YgiN